MTALYKNNRFNNSVNLGKNRNTGKGQSPQVDANYGQLADKDTNPLSIDQNLVNEVKISQINNDSDS